MTDSLTTRFDRAAGTLLGAASPSASVVEGEDLGLIAVNSDGWVTVRCSTHPKERHVSSTRRELAIETWRESLKVSK